MKETFNITIEVTTEGLNKAETMEKAEQLMPLIEEVVESVGAEWHQSVISESDKTAA
jgi:hypothetical protein